MSALFLGVDGGGTKTEFLCINEARVQLATATLGTTYHVEIGVDEAVRRIAQGVSVVCTALGAAPGNFAHVFFGLPGYGEDTRVDPQLHGACGALLGHDRYTCGNDMVCGWAGSLGCEDGINIVAGTGSIGYGERRGRSARSGGWGEVFGDEGSAYWIAVQGLTAFSRMSDGRTARGPLYDRLGAALSLEQDIELCERIMGERGMSRAEVAALAPIVTAAAADGDASCTAILDRAALHLFELVQALRESLQFTSDECVSLSWSGGVLTGATPVQRRFKALLAEAKGYKLIEPRHPAAFGAALYAMSRYSRDLLRSPTHPDYVDP